MSQLLIRGGRPLNGVAAISGAKNAALPEMCAALLTRVMGSLLFGVTATDAVTFVTVPLLLAAIAALATYLPARRASEVDPMEAFRA